jgi:hypothetical protein
MFSRTLRFGRVASGGALAPEPQCRKLLLRIFGPELIRINLLIKTVRSAVSKNPVFFFCGVSREILKT